MTLKADDIDRELLKAVRQLPAWRVAEVLDFAQFLESQYGTPLDKDREAPSNWCRQFEQIETFYASNPELVRDEE